MALKVKAVERLLKFDKESAGMYRYVLKADLRLAFHEAAVRDGVGKLLLHVPADIALIEGRQIAKMVNVDCKLLIVTCNGARNISLLHFFHNFLTSNSPQIRNIAEYLLFLPTESEA